MVVHSWVFTSGYARLGVHSWGVYFKYSVPLMTVWHPHVLVSVPISPSTRVVLRPSSPPTVPEGNHSHAWPVTEYYGVVGPAEACWQYKPHTGFGEGNTRKGTSSDRDSSAELNKIFKFPSFLFLRQGLMYHRLAQNSLVAKVDPKLLDSSASASRVLGLQLCAAAHSSPRVP